jgi:aspartate-semialdehyde dehydrogenase
MKKIVAVAGATGAVGRVMLEVLAERDFPLGELRLFSSKRSAGKKLTYRGKSLTVRELKVEEFAGVDIALFSMPKQVSREVAWAIAEKGTVIVDNSNAWRADARVPLVVPEVNGGEVKKHQGVIANPNCSTIQMVVALNPLHDAARVKRVVVATYQAVSGAGQEAMEELEESSRTALAGKSVTPKVFPCPIAFNCIPQIPQSSAFEVNGFTTEEMKLHNETRKIMGDDRIQVCATTVRVPVLRAHSEAVNVELERPLSAEEAKEWLRNAPGVTLMDDIANQVWPTPLFAAGKDDVFVGRVRKDYTVPNGIAMWVVSDQLRKGAATNAVQIAEMLL